MRIAAAAIRIGQMVFALPPPARHVDVAGMLADGGYFVPLRRCVQCFRHEQHDRCTSREQGFITNSGMFVGRYQALRIAFRVGQTKRKPQGDNGLTSEDMW